MLKKIAPLAKLKFTDEEREQLTKERSPILASVEKLKELDLEQVPPTSYMTELTNVMREDEMKTSLTQEEASLNVPARPDDFFSVPKVIWLERS